ncbi:MAG: MFS transporter [Hyphomonadaceae bacterium]|nr:MFS transporter [Hyphomonadaceae bacterium]
MTLAASVVTANAYYVHPIIARVAEDFDVSASMIGIVPGFNQIALALGIFLLLPLGDRYSNRTLSTVFVWGQFLAITLMAFSRDFTLFVTGSTLLGFATIVPYLLPTYVSKRVDAQELGRVTAMLTTGIIAGILIARAGAGVVAEHLGWRTVYYIASSLMLVVAILLPLSMDRREPSSTAAKPTSYLALIGSMLPLTSRYPEVLLSGSIQALSFGIFISIWMGLGLHLTSAEMGYGVDTVGYLALLAIVNVVTTPRFGALADRMGPRKTRLVASGFRLVGISLFLVFGHSLWLLIIPILIANIFGPVMDVTGRMTILKESPEIRTRLMTVYIVFMFLGGGIASWAGTTVYDLWGWSGNATLAVSLSVIVSALSALAYLRYER